MPDTTPFTPASVRLAREEPQAFRHEHGRLYDALEHAAQIAELAGHHRLATTLRDDRRDVAIEIDEGDCQSRLTDAERRALTARTIRELEQDADGR